MSKKYLVAYYPRHQLYEPKPTAVLPSLKKAEAEVERYKGNSYYSASILEDRRKHKVMYKG